MVVIAAAYILLPTAPADTTINVVPQIVRSPVRLFPKKEMSSIAISSTVFGICLMMCKSPWPEVGLFIAVLGGALCAGVGIGVMTGRCNYRELHEQEVLSAQKEKLGEVLAEYGVNADLADELETLIKGRRDRVSFDTRHGTLVTERAGDGYGVELRQGEKEVKRAELVRGTDIGGGTTRWTETARNLVSPDWSRLLDLYK
jgi:hypothetical protein